MAAISKDDVLDIYRQLEMASAYKNWKGIENALDELFDLLDEPGTEQYDVG